MLSHLDKKGNAKIVDISSKIPTNRTAIATGKISISDATIELINKKQNKKGDIFTVAKIAGINAAKNTSNLIPLCHPIKIEDIEINFEISEVHSYIKVLTQAKCFEKTGIEMEALTATSVSLLTIFDMCKAVDKTMTIYDLKVVKKIGGKEDYSN